LVSCIVPAFNSARYIAETLDAIFAQTYRPIEVIVVDDGSTDGTDEIVARYGESISCVRQRNAGPATARNRGWKLAQGDFIAFCDADDLWHPEKLARQMAQFAAHPQTDWCVTHVQNFWIDELSWQRACIDGHPLTKPQPGFNTQCLLIRRHVLEKMGGFDARFRHADDTDILIRARDAGFVHAVLPDVLVRRRVHFTNYSRTGARQALDEMAQTVKDSLDRRRGSSASGARAIQERADGAC
jgi:glycosyltransferase involved in cell wall biosynthesis